MEWIVLPARAGGCRLVVLDFTALDAGVFFELTLGDVEGVAQSHIKVFVSLFVMVLAADDDVFLRNTQVNANVKEITLMLVSVFCFHRNLATDDVIAKLFQLRRLFPDFCLDSVGMRKATKRNL
jgi:hypothetical protein